MVLAGKTFDELNAILKANDYLIESNEFWDKHDVIILKKGKDTYTLSFETFYSFPFVVRYLNSLGIIPPEDCQKPYDQYMDYLERKRKKENPT